MSQLGKSSSASTLGHSVERVRKGTRFTVIYSSRPAFQIVPVDDKSSVPVSLTDDTLHRAQPVGSSDDGRTSLDHDAILKADDRDHHRCSLQPSRVRRTAHDSASQGSQAAVS
jgi:hypothetical protein